MLITNDQIAEAVNNSKPDKIEVIKYIKKEFDFDFPKHRLLWKLKEVTEKGLITKEDFQQLADSMTAKEVKKMEDTEKIDSMTTKEVEVKRMEDAAAATAATAAAAKSKKTSKKYK